MLRIAVCDDDRAICCQLESMLADIGASINKSVEIEVFFSGEELCRFLFNGYKYDLIFLDIELFQINGVEVGKKIRGELNDEITQIVYISGKESYAMDLFEIRPLNFLIKPLSREKVEEVIKKFLRISEKNNCIFEYRSGNVSFSILLSEILYFESDGRKVNIALGDTKKSFYGKLSDVEEQLNSKDFIMIHKSYLVNYRHVIEHAYDYVRMSNREVLAISQNNRKAVREKLLYRKQGI